MFDLSSESVDHNIPSGGGVGGVAKAVAGDVSSESRASDNLLQYLTLGEKGIKLQEI